MELKDVKGIGTKSLALLNKLGIYTVNDLITYYPVRYDVLKQTDFNNLSEDMKVIVDGRVESIPLIIRIKAGLNKMNFRLATNDRIFGVSIFNRAFMKQHLSIGSNVIVIGKYDKVKNIIHLLNSYINKYKNKIKKCYDSNCIMLYDSMENMRDELQEILDLQERKKTKPNLKPFESAVEEYMFLLDGVNFDKLIDSKKLPYEKKANEKLPKKVNLKIINDLEIKTNILIDEEKQKELNNNFINDYFKTTGINLNEEQEQKDFIFDTLNRIKDLNNAIVDYHIYKDKCILNIFNHFLINSYLKQDITVVKDITYINLFNKLKDISVYISNNNIDLAFEMIKDLINQFKNLYERMS